MVQRCDEVGNVLGAVYFVEPLAGQQSIGAVSQVGGEYSIDIAVFICLIELFQTVDEQTVSCIAEYAASLAFLQSVSNIQHRFAGGNNVVGNKYVLAFYGVAQIFVCYDRVMSVDDLGIVTTLVEHTHRYAQHRSVVHVPVQSTLVRTDDHKLVRCCLEMRDRLEHCLQHLIGRHHVVKAHQRNGIVYAGVVCIYSQNVGHAHLIQFLQCTGTVQRFAVVPAVLTAAVQDRHDHVDTVCLTAGCLNQTLQILIVVVRRHCVHLIVHLIFYVVVSYVHNDEQILTADSRLDQSLAVTGRKTRAFRFDQECVYIITTLVSPVHQVVIQLIAQFLCTFHCNQSERCNAGSVIEQNV